MHPPMPIEFGCKSNLFLVLADADSLAEVRCLYSSGSK